MWYRRSRLCAREVRWLDDSKEGLFSPATSTDIIRMIPAMYLAWKEMKPDEHYAMIALDIKRFRNLFLSSRQSKAELLCSRRWYRASVRAASSGSTISSLT